MRTTCLLALAVLALVACSGPSLAQSWEKPDHTPPNVGDISYCRQESRRQANALYPPRPMGGVRDAPLTTDDRNFRAEIGFYDQCMARLGYVRAPATR